MRYTSFVYLYTFRFVFYFFIFWRSVSLACGFIVYFSNKLSKKNRVKERNFHRYFQFVFWDIFNSFCTTKGCNGTASIYAFSFNTFCLWDSLKVWTHKADEKLSSLKVSSLWTAQFNAYRKVQKEIQWKFLVNIYRQNFLNKVFIASSHVT